MNAQLDIDMTMLGQLRGWVPIEEAAAILTAAFGEDIGVNDIHGLAGQGKIGVSVIFSSTLFARKISQILDADEFLSFIQGKPELLWFEVGNRRAIVEPDILKLEGVFDYAMIGGERNLHRNPEWDDSPSHGLPSEVIVLRNERGDLIVPGGSQNGQNTKGNVAQAASAWYWFPDSFRLVIRYQPLMDLVAEVAGKIPEENRRDEPTLGHLDEQQDPSDLPPELDAAMVAYRAVKNGYGPPGQTFRNRLIAWLKDRRPDLQTEARERIATIANPDKSPGRKTFDVG